MQKVFFCSIALLVISTGVAAGAKMVNGVKVREWSAVDLRKDQYISPEEM